MKIAMIGHKRIPGREGGVEVVVEELAKRMAKEGHEVTVYNRAASHKKKHQVKEFEGVKIKTIPTIEKKGTEAIVYSFLASIHALFCRYDIIHYHALGPSVMLLIPHIFGIKTIVTVHGLNYKTPKWKGLGAKVIRLGELISVKYADEIIVLSKEQQKYFENKYSRMTWFIPNGVTLGKISNAEMIQKKWNLSKNGYLLFLSRIVPGKGLEHLLEAYKKIDTQLPLVIAGTSTYVDKFYEKICNDIKVDERIKLVGFVSGKLLDELYSNAMLFIFPSEAEGMPMCLLEALSYNTLCLVSDIPENLEVGKSYIKTFKVADADDLKRALENALLTKEIHEDSRLYIAENYNWEQIVLRTLLLYKEVIETCH